MGAAVSNAATGYLTNRKGLVARQLSIILQGPGTSEENVELQHAAQFVIYTASYTMFVGLKSSAR